MRLFIWGVLTPSCGDPFWDMPSIEVRIATCQNKRCIPNWGWFKTIQNPCARAPEKWYHRKPTPLEHNALPSQSYKAWSLDWSESWIDPTRNSEGHSSLLAIPRAPVDLIEAAGSFASDHAPSHLDRFRWPSVPLNQGVSNGWACWANEYGNMMQYGNEECLDSEVNHKKSAWKVWGSISDYNTKQLLMNDDPFCQELSK